MKAYLVVKSICLRKCQDYRLRRNEATEVMFFWLVGFRQLDYARNYERMLVKLCGGLQGMTQKGKEMIRFYQNLLDCERRMANLTFWLILSFLPLHALAM